MQSITIRNDYGTGDFGIYIKVIEHDREKIISRLLREGFTVQMAIDDCEFDDFNLFPKYSTMREKNSGFRMNPSTTRRVN